MSNSASAPADGARPADSSTTIVDPRPLGLPTFSLIAVGVGVITGLALAFALARLASNLLVGVRPDDPLIFGGVTLVIVAVAIAASWLPARQATRVDPMQALRME